MKIRDNLKLRIYDDIEELIVKLNYDKDKINDLKHAKEELCSLWTLFSEYLHFFRHGPTTLVSEEYVMRNE